MVRVLAAHVDLHPIDLAVEASHDLAAEMPDKLRELQRQFLIEAVRYKVLPLDDRRRTGRSSSRCA